MKLNLKPKSHPFLLQKTINMLIPDRNKVESIILEALTYQISFVFFALYFLKGYFKILNLENG